MGTLPKQADHRGNDMDVSAFWKIINDARSNATDDEDFLTRIDSRVRMLGPGELLEKRSKTRTRSPRWKTQKASSRSSCTLRGRLTKGKLASKCPTPFFKERPGLNSVFFGMTMPPPR